MNTFYDILAKYQKYLLGLAIFISLTSVSISITKEETALNFANHPLIILSLIAFSILLVLIYIQIDQRKISSLSDSILEIAQDKNETSSEPLPTLTDRQEEVYKLILSGKSNKEIMAVLFIEQSTLKSHINQIYKKLNIKNRKELKAKAV